MEQVRLGWIRLWLGWVSLWLGYGRYVPNILLAPSPKVHRPSSSVKTATTALPIIRDHVKISSQVVKLSIGCVKIGRVS